MQDLFERELAAEIDRTIFEEHGDDYGVVIPDDDHDDFIFGLVTGSGAASSGSAGWGLTLFWLCFGCRDPPLPRFIV